jgi:hypothetical protein
MSSGQPTAVGDPQVSRRSKAAPSHHDRHPFYDHHIEQARFEALPCERARGEAHVLVADDLLSEGDGGLDSSVTKERFSAPG